MLVYYYYYYSSLNWNDFKSWIEKISKQHVFKTKNSPHLPEHLHAKLIILYMLTESLHDEYIETRVQYCFNLIFVSLLPVTGAVLCFKYFLNVLLNTVLMLLSGFYLEENVTGPIHEKNIFKNYSIFSITYAGFIFIQLCCSRLKLYNLNHKHRYKDIYWINFR